MAIPLKQSAASQEIPLGYFLDSTDGNTEETALTIANTDIKLWKNGAVVLANKNAGGATHISNGIYYAVLDATDTDTSGPLVIFVHVTGALAIRLECVVYPANVFDSLFSTDKLQVDLVSLGDDAQSLTDLKDFADAGYDPATNKVQGVVLVDTVTTVTGGATAANQTTIINRLGDFAGSGLNTIKGFLQAMFRKDAGVSGANTPSEINEIENTFTGAYDGATDSQEATRDTAPIGTAMRGTDNAALASVCTEGRLAELDAANIPADVDSIKAKTDLLAFTTGNVHSHVKAKDNIDFGALEKVSLNAATPASVTGAVGSVTGSIGSLATQAKADINAEVAAALASINLDHLVGTASGIPAVPAGTYLDQLMDDGTASFDRTTDSLQAIKDGGLTLGTDAITSDTMAASAVTEIQSGLATQINVEHYPNG